MTKTVIDINESTIKKYVESIRPGNPEIRKQLDFGYTYDKMVIELYEIRPSWVNPKEIMNNSFAKIRFYKSKQVWKLYWRRASGKWDLYEPSIESTHLDKIIEVIKNDKHGCFFG